MQTSLSITTDDFHFYSHGKGLAYTLYNRSDRSDLFFQGDDALTLALEIEDLETAGFDYDTILTHIWNHYTF